MLLGGLTPSELSEKSKEHAKGQGKKFYSNN